jgi:hypothetical protein
MKASLDVLLVTRVDGGLQGRTAAAFFYEKNLGILRATFLS